MVAHVFNLNIREAETGRFLGVQSQSYRDPVSKNKQKHPRWVISKDTPGCYMHISTLTATKN